MSGDQKNPVAKKAWFAVLLAAAAWAVVIVVGIVAYKLLFG